MFGFDFYLVIKPFDGIIGIPCNEKGL